MNDFFYLSHGGPGSGRYPLGSGERPYQKFEKSRSLGSSIVGYIKSKKAAKAEKARQKEMEERRKAAQDAAEQKRQHDAAKEEVLRKGSATEILKYQGELTNQEMQNAVNRLRLESDLKSFSREEAQAAIKKVDRVMDKVKTGTNWVKTATDTYNTLAAIYNATESGRSKPLTLVNKGGGNQQQQDKKK